MMSKKTIKSRSDNAVQGTNDSSILSKASAAQHGYFDDSFLIHFISKRVRRSPLIHRGYYIRAKAMDHVLKTFLASHPGKPKQVLNLGAGFDSSFFRLKAENLLSDTRVIEIDFPDVLRRKLALIKQSPELMSLMELDTTDETSNQLNIIYRSRDLSLVAVDLSMSRELNLLCDVVQLDASLPTLLFSEVAITYMSPQHVLCVINWAAATFSNALFATYEQLSGLDTKSLVKRLPWCQHFANIGSPLKTITSVPDCQAQCQRYTSQGWDEVMTVDMNEFFYGILPASERERMCKLEAFDEYEEWTVKCSHYVLVTAGRGSCKALLPALWSALDPPTSSSSSHSTNPQLSHAVPASSITEVNLKMMDAEFFSYGHDSAEISLGTKKYILSCGGFGIDNKQHGRLSNLNFLDHTGGQHFTLSAPVLSDGRQSKSLERLYHTLTALNSQKVVMIGGRHSPLKPVPDVYILTVDDKPHTSDAADTAEVYTSMCNTASVQCTVQRMECKGDFQLRWRHSAIFTSVNGLPKVVVYGGINPDGVLADCVILDLNTSTWLKMDILGSGPGSRHSHSAAVWRDCCVISCGLGPQLNLLNSVFLLNVKTWQWSQLNCHNLIPRYGHTSAVVGDNLLLIGGVSLSERPLGVTVLSLETASCSDLYLPLPRPDAPVLLHGHSSVVRHDNSIVIIGGGGNCFSFGTHFNKSTCVLTLPQEHLS